MAAAIRVYLYFHTSIISLDGAFQFIPIAKLFTEGDFKAALGHGQLPLYPILIALVSKTGLDLETSGRLISLVFSLMTIFPLYFLTKGIFNSKIAFISCIFFAIHPYFARFSVDVLKDSLYVFLFIFSIWLGWRALEGKALFPFLILGVFGGLTYLTRPDGLEIFLAMVGWILFYQLPRSRKEYVRRACAFLLLCATIFALAVPYILHIHKTTGRWTISRTKHISALLGQEKDVAQKYFGEAGNLPEKMGPSVTRRVLPVLYYGVRKAQNVFHPLLILFFLIGLIARKAIRFQKGELYLLSFFVLHFTVLYLFIFHYSLWDKGQLIGTHLSGRHFLPSLAISFSWMSAGFFVINDRTVDWFEKRKPLYSITHQKVFIIILVIIFGSVLPKTLKSVRSEKIGRKDIGLWIKNREIAKPLILTDAPRVAYYAGGTFLRLRRSDYEKNISEAKVKGIKYIVAQQKNIEKNYPHLIQLAENDFSLQEVPQLAKKGQEKLLIFESRF